jgi:hypothetical protein
MPNHKDITGQKFGKWTAIKHVGSDKNKNAMWKCVNESGEKRDISANYLRQYLHERLRVAKNRGFGKYYLGSLCKRGHEHENTGKSQRYRFGRSCVVCAKLKAKKRNKKKKCQKTQCRKSVILKVIGLRRLSMPSQ